MSPYYSDASVTIYHGDCRDVLPGLSADACVTDPPYGTENPLFGYGRRQLYGGKGRTIVGDVGTEALVAALPGIAGALSGVGWVVVFCAAKRRPEVDREMVRCELEYFGEVIWNKAIPGLGVGIRYMHETALVYQSGEPAKSPHNLLSVITSTTLSRVDAAVKHPHEKPTEVMELLVQWACPENRTVLDPFAGSGTTLVAAKNLGRNAIGIEIEERYCEIAAERCRQEVLAL